MKRLPVRKIRDALRMTAAGMSPRKIAPGLGIGRTTLRVYLRRAKEAGLSWPLPDGINDADLEARLFPGTARNRKLAGAEPDYPTMHRELRRNGVTLYLLWLEYRESDPDGYGYSRYCELYRAWEGKLSPTMRQRHEAGEALFVDYAGATIDITDPQTGEVRAAQVFVAALGASNYTYVETTWTQTLEDWISSHVRALEFFGGATETIVPDNLKSGIAKACLHDPEVNRSYAEMAAYYDLIVIPARPGKPRDKAKVEAAVLLAERWIIAKLRNRTFFSLTEANAAIAEALDQLNNRVTRHLGASRRELFETIDKPALRPLPVEPYIFGRWKKCRAGIDYHIEIERHYYSVPYQLIRQPLWARFTARTVEVFFKNKRVASHVRSSGNRKHTTVRDHMPASHRFRAGMSREKLAGMAERHGSNVVAFVEVAMDAKGHPEQGFRTCLGVLKLAKPYGSARLNAACARAIDINGLSFTSVRSILENGLDRRDRHRTADEPAITHQNIRGADYFH